MMTGPHPHDLELLDYVEDELPNARRREVGAHVESCATCEATVGELDAARAALRAAPTLELPADGRERIRAALADSDGGRRSTPSPLRLVALLAPVAVLAAVVAGVVTMADFGGDDAGGGGEAAMVEAEEDAASRGTEGAGAEDPDAGAGEVGDSAPGDAAETPPTTGAQAPLSAAGPVASVGGPAEEVAAILRDRGFDARAEGDNVVVRNARPRAVVQALVNRPRGPVAVAVE